jgi:hypothetical protein
MGYIEGEGRNQGTLFPVVLDDLVPADHMCRVFDAFVERVTTSDLGFERAMAAETGATRLGSARFVELVSERLSKPDPLVAALRS